MGCELTVGTLRFARPTDYDSAGVATLPRDGELTEYFPQNHGGGVFHGTARRHASAAKKPRLAATKITLPSVCRKTRRCS
jgi:hypothetical protein